MSDASRPWDETWRIAGGDVVRGGDVTIDSLLTRVIHPMGDYRAAAALIAAAPAMARLLCRLEWTSVQDETGCVVCGEFADADVPEHTADCLLDAVLTQAGISPEERERVRGGK